MNSKELKKAFIENKTVFGTLVASTSPKWAGEIQKTGVDFVFIDSEHMPMNPAERSWMCRCYSAMNIAPLVRISHCSAIDAFQAIESGAQGIISPYLESVEEIKTLIGAVKYRPLKGEKLRRVLNGEYELSEKERNYLEKYNEGNLLVLNIESRFAVDNIEKLLAFPEVDAVFIGPHDLSINLGIPEEYDNPEFENCVERVINACIKNGKGIGNHSSGQIEKQVSWAEKGMNIIIWNSDIAQFVCAAANDFKLIKERLNICTEINEEGVTI